MDIITIIINSTKSYAPITLPPLLHTLIQYNPGFNILVIIGDCLEKRIVSQVNFLTIVETDNNSLDFTGIITLLEKPELLTTPWFLYLHDTIGIGSTFFQCLLDLNLTDSYEDETNKITTISFQFPSANIGLYHKNVIERLKPAILQLKNTNNSILQELKSLSIVTEDAIFRMNMQEHSTFPTKSIPNSENELEDPYKTGVKRLKEYYPDLDFWKYKASYSLAYTYTMKP
jgi:hypothetical protein